ncbi:IS3 family transposase [Luedemannella helvata]|uniref:Transposase n=1 Tax=Luedemannella helvata TaxID=349315 RepID=A0ABN2L7K3_9ACTN
MSSKYECIDGERAHYPVVKMCAWVAVSRAGYYEWHNRPASATVERRTVLAQWVREVFADSDETYGYRRVWHELRRRGIECGPELVRDIMREHNLVACQPRPWRLTTVADPDAPTTPDLVGRDFTAHAPGVKLVGDITYIPTWQGFVYLATVIDCHTKMVAGYAIADRMNASLVCDAFIMAAQRLTRAPQAIFHSDRLNPGSTPRRCSRCGRPAVACSCFPVAVVDGHREALVSRPCRRGIGPSASCGSCSARALGRCSRASGSRGR